MSSCEKIDYLIIAYKLSVNNEQWVTILTYLWNYILSQAVKGLK